MLIGREKEKNNYFPLWKKMNPLFLQYMEDVVLEKRI